MVMPLGWMRTDISAEWLRSKYVEEKLSTNDIASLCGYSPSHVRRLLDKFDIPTRSRAEGVQTSLSRDKRRKSMTGKMVGQNNPAFKCGQWLTSGYWHTRRNGKTYRIHRAIAEQMIGRRLNPDEVVHHINGIKTDNRPENLEVMVRAEHIRMHSKARWKLRRVQR